MNERNAWPTGPVVCVITDRMRLAVADPLDAVVRQVRRSADAGVELVQLRERDLDGGPLTELAVRCLDAIGDRPTRLVINDRLDVALAAGAHGVHLRSDSAPPGRVRARFPAQFIGRSVHRAEEAIPLEADVDYFFLGPVFPTRSKGPDAQTLGAAAFSGAARRLARPVIAVGGITLETAGRLAGCGAAGIAAIGLFAPWGLEGGAGDPAALVARLRTKLTGQASDA
jgi:thiamine-phosphate pyrophosphorylase